MNEVSKKWAPVFDSANREVSEVKLDDLTEVGVSFNAYGISPKDVIIVDENPLIVKQAPRREGQNPTYLIAVTRNGNKSWLNPTFFLRQDSELNPVYPAWAALGSAKVVVEKLIKLHSITGGEPFKVQMTAFNRDGSFKEVAVRDESGNIVLNEDGTPQMKRTTNEREFPALPEPPKDEAAA